MSSGADLRIDIVCVGQLFLAAACQGEDCADDDFSPMVLEKFSKCSMVEGTSNFIGLKIGTIDLSQSHPSLLFGFQLS